MYVDIKVSIFRRAGQRIYQMQYRDPVSGKKTRRTTGHSIRREAERAAAKWEDELRDGRYVSPSRVTWQDFRTRYESEVLESLADSTAQKTLRVFNELEKQFGFKRLLDVTEGRLSEYQAKLRERGLSENTIKSYLSHLAAAFSWAVAVRLLPRAPRVSMPKRAKGGKVMKGRPITGEEFERLLEAVPKVIERKDPTKKKYTPEDRAKASQRVEAWRHFLRGLWLSGLRLEEALELYWDRDDRLCVDVSGRRPMLWIPAALEKGNQDRLLPITPDFAELLMATPAVNRVGRVFEPNAQRKHGERLTTNTVSKTICKIGKAAKVKVHTDPRSGRIKYASAHDLRRSFGERWSSRVMPAVLQVLMRHEDIQTTLKYYVGRNAQATAEVIWAAHESRSATEQTPLSDQQERRAISGRG